MKAKLGVQQKIVFYDCQQIYVLPNFLKGNVKCANCKQISKILNFYKKTDL